MTAFKSLINQFFPNLRELINARTKHVDTLTSRTRKDHDWRTFVTKQEFVDKIAQKGVIHDNAAARFHLRRGERPNRSARTLLAVIGAARAASQSVL